MQGSSMAGRAGLASAGRDMLADWRRWSARERTAALAVLAISPQSQPPSSAVFPDAPRL
jgi:hypothetical protein